MHGQNHIKFAESLFLNAGGTEEYVMSGFVYTWSPKKWDFAT